MVSKALIAASTKPLILSLLKYGKSYGYQIIQNVKDISGGELQWSDGMLYPVLHRLEKEGLVLTQWILSENGRMRKYYQITDDGLNALEAEKQQWEAVHRTLTQLWTSKPSFAV